MVGLPKEMTAEEAAAELAYEELRQKWAEEEHRRELLYIRTQQERELKMQMLRSRAQSRACVDLTADSNDEGDVKIKTELHTEHELGSGSAIQPMPSALQVLQMPAPSRASTRSMPRTGEQMSVPATNTVQHENDSFRPGNNFAGFKSKFADFTCPYPEQLPTIVKDPNGIPGRDYIELRCGECGANFGRNRTFIKGAWGFYAHLKSIHDKKYPKGTLPSAAQLVDMCAYRAVSRQEVESLRRQKSKIEVVLSPGAEDDHPSKRKRNKSEVHGKTSELGRRSAKSPRKERRTKSPTQEKS
ncbi:hypothetical protein CKM354_000628500 [Cercospora kikuchii]|uniref:Uncharacterized protein n=1 Tax=Cercospora kikuchii TaxID=84275 RepID=A0A9P3CJ36_9PEZI|nr:uncharacterized protein CKM354_000628500 [Cercospora kikuchii]GIZ43041.1 hypothetical protein CKM354_000628500 [Cercospora kikuchii]